MAEHKISSIEAAISDAQTARQSSPQMIADVEVELADVKAELATAYEALDANWVIHQRVIAAEAALLAANKRIAELEASHLPDLLARVLKARAADKISTLKRSTRIETSASVDWDGSAFWFNQGISAARNVVRAIDIAVSADELQAEAAKPVMPLDVDLNGETQEEISRQEDLNRLMEHMLSIMSDAQPLIFAALVNYARPLSKTIRRIVF